LKQVQLASTLWRTRFGRGYDLSYDRLGGGGGGGGDDDDD